MCRCTVQAAHRREPGTGRDKGVSLGGSRRGVWFRQYLPRTDTRDVPSDTSCRLTHVPITRSDGLWVYPLCPDSVTHARYKLDTGRATPLGIDRTWIQIRSSNGTACTLKINAPHPRCRQGCAGCGVNLLVQLPSSIGLRRAQGYLGNICLE